MSSEWVYRFSSDWSVLRHRLGCLALVYLLKEVSLLNKNLPDFRAIYDQLKAQFERDLPNYPAEARELLDSRDLREIFTKVIDIMFSYHRDLFQSDRPDYLDCLLQEIGLEKKKEDCSRFVYDFEPLFFSEEVIFPKEAGKLSGNPEDGMKELWLKFYKDLSFVLKNGNYGPVRTFSLLSSFLFRYCWCLPAVLPIEGSLYYSTKVSLYEFLRLYTVLLLSLFSPHNIKGLLTLFQVDSRKALSELRLFHLKGDISGIQNFLISTMNIAGTARRLRGKSFFLSLLDRLTSRYLLHRLGYPEMHAIFSSGGHFEVLIGYEEHLQEEVEGLRYELEKYLLSTFCGELGLVLTGHSYTLSELFERGYAEVISSILYRVGEAKKKKFLAYLESSSEERIREELNLDLIRGEAQRLCPACGKFLMVEGKEATCRWCSAFFEMGRVLPEAKFLVIIPDGLSEEAKLMGLSVLLGGAVFDLGVLGVVGLLREPLPLSKLEDGIRVIRLNDTRIIDKGQVVADGFMAVEQHIPFYRGSQDVSAPRTFEELARSARGDDKLAYVKGDLDNLGHILQSGTRKLSLWLAVSALSSHLDLFFSGYLRHLLNTSTYREHIYTIYAGGDDFLLVGAWNEALRFLRLLREKFYLYTGKNEALHFSAGVVLTRADYPVRLALEAVQEALESAKQKKPSVDVFGDTISWKSFSLLFSSSTEEIYRLLEQEVLERSFMYKLYQLTKQHIEYKNKNDIRMYRFYPLFFYYLNRNVKCEQTKQMLIDWIIDRENEFRIREEALVKFRYILTLSRKRGVKS